VTPVVRVVVVEPGEVHMREVQPHLRDRVIKEEVVRQVLPATMVGAEVALHLPVEIIPALEETEHQIVFRDHRSHTQPEVLMVVQ
jgi:hypothetical protein